MSSLPPAGWYDDPEHPGYLRYWDGSEWTDHRSPTSGPTAGRLTDVGSWLNQTFRDLWDRRVPLLLIGAALLALWIVAGLLVSWALSDLVYRADGGWDGFHGGRAAMAATGLLVVAFASLVIYIAAIHQLYRARFGEDPTIGESVTVATAAIPTILGWGLALFGAALAALVVLVVLAGLAPGLAVIAILLVLPAIAWAWVKLSFFLVAIVAPVPGRNPIRSSATVSAGGRFWAVFGRLLLLTFIGSAVAYVLSLPLGTVSGTANVDQYVVTEGDEILVFDVGGLVDEFGFGGGVVLMLSTIPNLLNSVISISGTTGLYAQINGRNASRPT